MKKVKATLLTVLLAAVAVAFTVFQFKPEPKYYVPHDVAQKQNDDAYPDKGIRGAIDFWAARKPNQFTGIVDPSDVEAAYMQARQMPRSKNGRLNWKSMGPDNVGGRTRALVIDKDDNRVLYSGGVSSGFFKSTNQGLSWKKTTQTENQMVVSMIQTSDGNIYFGTGEQFFTRNSEGNGSSGFMGNGIYKSTDKGETFTHLTSTRAVSVNSAWTNVNALADDPRDPNTFYAGTMNGLMVTTDGGTTFSLLTPNPTASLTVCSDIRVSPDGQTIFAVFQNRQQTTIALLRSTDFGATFTEVGTKVPNPEITRTSISRLVIAIAPSQPNIVYASAARSFSSTNPSQSHRCERIYRSTDNGDSWTPIGVGSDLFIPFTNSAASSGQGDYDNIIAVDPRNPNRIFLGGVQFYSWSNTQGWLLSAGLTYFSGAFRNDNYIHADKHNIVFDTTVNPYIMYVTSDGGIAKSTNAQNTARPTYGTITKNFVTTQFYSVAGSIMGEAIGGTQDNGTIGVAGQGLNSRTGSSIMGGDGGYAAISKINPTVYFAETQYGNLVRSLDKGNAWSSFWDERAENAFNEYRSPFVTPFDLWEDWRSVHNPRAKFAIGIGEGVWFTEEPLVFSKTPVWYRISPGILPSASVDGGTIEFTPDGGTLFYSRGTRLYRISGLNDLNFATDCDSANGRCAGPIKVTEVFNSGGQHINGIGIDPQNGNRVVVVLGNYGNTNYVYITNNALDTVNNVSFTSIQKNLPRVPVYDAIIVSNDSSAIILGTEIGVFATYDAGSTSVDEWVNENTGDMDIVPVMMLSQVEQFLGLGPVIFIGTHGRGIYKSNELTSSVKPKPQVATNVTLGPNPAVGNTTLRYELQKPVELTLSIYDINGKLISLQRIGKQPAGIHQRNLNVSGYSSGVYFVNLTGDGIKSSVKMIVGSN